MSTWFTIIGVAPFRLWRDEPAAHSLTLSCTAEELERLIEALPTTKAREHKIHHPVLAAVRRRDGTVRSVGVHLTSVSPKTDPAQLHTGNGAGDWIVSGDSIQILGFDES